MFRFLNTDGLTALGWSLLNGIWQMAILWLAYLALTRNHKRFSAAARHNLALLFSGLGFIWFSFSLIMGLAHPEGFINWAPLAFILAVRSSILSTFIYTLTDIYLIIIVFRSARYIMEFFQLKIRKRGSGIPFSSPLQFFANKVSPVMGIRKKIKVMLADWVDSAQTVGFLRPLVLLPVALVNQLTVEQTETILMHELHHIRRHDYLINILMTLFQTIFFFNPFARLFFKTVAEERENACDDGVLQWNYPPPVYAEALFTLEKFRQFPHSFAMAANGHNPRLLVNRIRRVVGQPVSNKNPFSPLMYFSLIAALFIFTINSVSRLPAPGTGFQGKANLMAATAATFMTISEKSNLPAGELSKTPESVRTRPRLIESSVFVFRMRRHTIKVKHQKIDIGTEDPLLLMKMDEAKANAQLHYADQNEVRNYSNEKAPDPQPPVAADLVGAPYVPSASFFYQPATDTLKPDLLLQNQLSALAVISRIKTEEMQARLNKEICSKLSTLRGLEKENSILIRQSQKNLQPLILNLKKDIQLKMKEINHLRIQLQIQGGEVIVI